MQGAPWQALPAELHLRHPGCLLLPAHAGGHDLQRWLLLCDCGGPVSGPFFVLQLAVRGDAQLGGLLSPAGVMSERQALLPSASSQLAGRSPSANGHGHVSAWAEPVYVRGGSEQQLELQQNGSSKGCCQETPESNQTINS